MLFWSRLPTAARLKEVVIVAALYFICAAASMRLTRFDGGLAIVWVAGAVLFAKLSITPRQRWSLLVFASFLAAMTASYLFGLAGRLTPIMASAAVGEAVGAAWLLKRFYPRFGRFEALGETGYFLLVCGVIAPAVGASIGATCAHLVAGMPFGEAWRDWYAGHALGLIVFAPPIVLGLHSMGRLRPHAMNAHKLFEASGLLAAVFIAACVTFGQNAIPLVIVPIVPMIAATFRLGRLGAIASILIVVAVGLVCSLSGLGPTTLLQTSMATKFVVLQVYFACLVLVLLPIAAELNARRRLLNRLYAAEALYRLILDRTSDVVLRLSSDGIVLYVSPCVRAAWGYSPDQLVGKSIFDFIDENDAPVVKLARQVVLLNPDQTRTVEYRIRRQSGELAWVESHIRGSVDESGRASGTVSIIREYTERRQAIEDLATLAMTDPLTGLHNRRVFENVLSAHLGADPSTKLGCVAIFDLDHFKRINDRHGHVAGDGVLKRFAKILGASVREGDVAARLGGEEFAVLFRHASLDQAWGACERIRQKLALLEELSSSGEIIRATTSAGIAEIASGQKPENIMASADAALYQAKNAGRNQLAIAA